MHRPGKAHWENRFKKKFRFKATAHLFALYYNKVKFRDQWPKVVYPCYWTDDFRDGESGPKHYHHGTNRRLVGGE